MKTLIITAHPKTDSFTHAIAERYAKSAFVEWKEVDMLDLYRSELRQDFFEFSDIKNLPSDPKRWQLQLLIKKADEFVFIYPLWWWAMPAIMKNFIDRNFTAGFAYRYKRHKWIPKFLDLKPTPLLKGKKARIFFTCDAPTWTIPFVALPHLINLSISVLNFCGIRLSSWKSFASMRHSSIEKREWWLTYVERLAKK
jgi:NAD(P)H dehydrogenase (quinone)